MTTSPEAPELIQYSCERCKTRFVLPPSSRRLGIAGALRAFSMGIGRSLKTHESLRDGISGAGRELLSKMDDDAYQAFVLSFRFCHECRQFVCNDCWSKSRGTCLTCSAKATGSPARIKPIVTAAAVTAIQDVPRPIVTSAPQRRGRTRRDFGLVGMTLAIVLISIEGGVLLLNATSGPTDVSAGQTQNHSLTPGSSAARQWIVTPPPNTLVGGRASSSSGPYATESPTGTLAPGQTAGPRTTRRPGSTGNPGQPPTPAPGQLIITASNGTMVYGGTVPTITATYAGFVNGDTEANLTTKPTCITTATSSSPVASYISSCSGAVDPKYVITYGTGTVTVTPAPLTITASGGTMTYGGAVPGITAGYSGFVNGETPASLTTGPTCTTTATGTSPVASYPSTCLGAVDTNYTITDTPGSVSVTAAPLTITASDGTMVAGNTPPAISPLYAGLSAGDSAPTTPPSCSTDATSSSPAGNYTTSCLPAVDANYTFTYVTGTFIVTP